MPDDIIVIAADDDNVIGYVYLCSCDKNGSKLLHPHVLTHTHAQTHTLTHTHTHTHVHMFMHIITYMYANAHTHSASQVVLMVPCGYGLWASSVVWRHSVCTRRECGPWQWMRSSQHSTLGAERGRCLPLNWHLVRERGEGVEKTGERGREGVDSGVVRVQREERTGERGREGVDSGVMRVQRGMGREEGV